MKRLLIVIVSLFVLNLLIIGMEKKNILILHGIGEVGNWENDFNNFYIDYIKKHNGTHISFYNYFMNLSDVPINQVTTKKIDHHEVKDKIEYLIGIPLKDMTAKLMSYPENTVIYFITYELDPTQKKYNSVQTVSKLSELLSYPIFGFFDTLLGHGIIGGNLTSTRSYAEEAGKVTLAILQDINPVDIKIPDHISKDYYDWRQLKKFGIKEKHLPAGSIIKYKTLSFWEKYLPYMAIIFFIIVLQMILIVILLINRVLKRKAERYFKALEESEEKFRDFTNSITNIYFAMDKNLNYTYWNATCEALMGYKSEDVLGKSYYDFDFNNDYHWIAEKYKNTIKTGKPDSFEAEFDTGDVTVYFLVNTYPTKKGVVVYLQDITQIKEAEKKLKNSLEEKVILLKEIHHRVKNNLQVISSMLGLQIFQENDKKVVDALMDSKNRIQAMALVHERLYRSDDFSRLNIHNLINGLLKDIMYINIQKKVAVQVHKDIAPITLTLIQSVPFALILNELIGNAYKHAFKDKNDGVIYISISKNEETKKIHCTIKDNGCGIPEDLNIFKTKTIGLQIVTSLVKQLMGTITYTYDNGANFSLNFPIEEETLES